jgi:class 3 adenylate cyclase
LDKKITERAMFRSSIRTKILTIAVGLIILMVITAALSLAFVTQVARRFEQLTNSYIPAYGDLARANIRSLERALALRRMVIAKSQSPPDQATFSAARDVFDAKGAEAVREGQSARALINGLITQGTSVADGMALARITTRIDAVLDDSRRHLNAEIERLVPLLDEGNAAGIADGLTRIDVLRDELDQKIDGIRSDMLALVRADAVAMLQRLHDVIWIAAALTAIAATLGLVFSVLVSTGMARPVRRLLEGTRAVEAGNLDETLVATSRDEIGHLTAAFNRMVEQLRLKERIRETFGKYIDPRVVEGLIDRPVLAADGQRRVMTVLFCDVKGFTGISEGMTPQGLVKVMNRYLSIMSEPIRNHQGIIDKYIGDAIMAYWGPPFTEDTEQARLACLAALDMVARVESLQAELPELLGVRNVPIAVDLRIGIATGEALVGSIGSEFMMSYTVMGDTVNLASRLEGTNKVYDTRLLVSEATASAAALDVEVREIDRIVVVGQTKPQAVFEVMGRKGALTPAQALLRSGYSEGLAAYRARNWDEARRGFAAAINAVPDDGPSATFVKRIDSLLADPPGVDWDGAWRLDQK